MNRPLKTKPPLANRALEWTKTGFRLLGAASAFATYTIEGLPSRKGSTVGAWWLKVTNAPGVVGGWRGHHRTQKEAQAAAEIHDVMLADKVARETEKTG